MKTIFLIGLHGETWKAINLCTVYAYAAVTGHCNCSAISPCKRMQLQFYYCNTQVIAGTSASKLRQGIWEAMYMKLWTYLEYTGCSTGDLTVLHGRKGKQITGNSKEQNNLGDHLLTMSCLLHILLLLIICPVLMVPVLLTSCVRGCRS